MKDFPNAWILVNDLIFGLNFILYTPFSPENECDPLFIQKFRAFNLLLYFIID